MLKDLQREGKWLENGQKLGLSQRKSVREGMNKSNIKHFIGFIN